jgi:hypothetical protein
MEVLGYRININGENDAFAGGEFQSEMARILRQLADDIERGKFYDGIKLRDINGNVVGECLADF